MKIVNLRVDLSIMLKIFQTLCLSALFVHTTFAQDSDADFSLVKHDDRIYVYERWITFPKSQPPIRAREVKGEFKITSTISAAVALLKNEKRIKDWQDHVTEFKVYPSNDSTTWREYSYHDIPWPVSDQDHFLEYKIDPVSTPERMFITFESIIDDSLAPEREDVTRMKLSGSWLIEKTGEGKIKVSYRILSKPIGIPRIFTDPVIRNNIMTTIRRYMEILEGKR